MNSYFRKFKLIPFSNLYLIRWKPNSITPIHSQGGYECNMYLLRGKLQESLYKQLNDGNGYFMIDSKIIDKNQCSHINDKKGLHTMKNLSDKHSYSINYYIKPKS